MRTRPIVVALLALSLLVVGVAPARGQESQGTACTARSDNDAVVRAFFGPLFERLGPIVGSPVGCIGEAPDGGVSVPTTTVLLYARPEGGGPVRLVAFTDGFRHWAVDANLTQVTLYW